MRIGVGGFIRFGATEVELGTATLGEMLAT